MRILLIFSLSFFVTGVPVWADPIVKIDPNDQGRTFDGIGALSAGASSRLLIDYPEPQRGEILDFLFKPSFGAALQINKVEIGGDMNSTDGSEPSHMFTPDQENYQRGYEWWLMEESKKRNPNVKLYGLEWGAPNWINPNKNDVWTSLNIGFITKWVQHAKIDHQLDIDYLGGWNERGHNSDWYKQFRKGLNDAGLRKIQIISDDSFDWGIGNDLSADPAFAASFEIVGEHYPGEAPKNKELWDKCQASGKPLWGSEIGSAHYNGGAASLAKLYNQGYLGSKMTAYINWSTIWSVLAGMPYNGSGLMLANQPWSGHYEVGASIWATAHTTQFAQPGWKYMDHACGYFGSDEKSGSYITMRSPDSHDFSVIVETIDAKNQQSASFMIAAGLPSGPLEMWRTNLHSRRTEDWFIQKPNVKTVNGVFSLSFDPGCVYSITTLNTPHKGVTTSPAAAMLPLPLKDDFQSYEIGATPKYFSDQNGTFEVAKAGGGRSGKCLRQMITAKPIVWNLDSDPSSMIGDPAWSNYIVSCDVLMEKPGYVEIIGRMMGTDTQNFMTGYHFQVSDTGQWSLHAVSDRKDQPPKEVASGRFAESIGTGRWHKLSLGFLGKQITASIDGTQVINAMEDTMYTRGLVGVQMNRWQTAEFMNFQVVPNGPQADATGGLAARGAKVMEVDSEAPSYDAENAIDGDPSTFWHTVWDPNPEPFPHFITLDLGKTYILRGIACLPRQDMDSCRTAQCEVYFSNDLKSWGAPVAVTTMSGTAGLQTIFFKTPSQGRYLKLVAKSSYNSPNTAFAEIKVLE